MSRNRQQREPGHIESEPVGILRLLEAALAHSADGVLVVDARGRLVFVNEAAQRLAQRTVRPGMSIEDLAAEFRLRYADGQPVLPEAVPLKRALRGESSVDTPLVIGKPDGTDVYISGTESPVRDEQGNVVGALCIYRDITDRKKAEDALRHAYDVLEERVQERTAQLARANEELRAEVASRQQTEEVLRESERRYRAFADSLPQIVFETDTEGRLLFVNRSAFEAFRYTRADFEKGLAAYQMLVPEQRAQARDDIRRVLSGEELGGREYTALRKDGTTFPIMIYSSRIVQHGKPVGLRGFIVDITDRKRAEQALAEQRLLLETILTQAADAIVVCDAQGNLTFVNAAARRITGLDPDRAALDISHAVWGQAYSPDGRPVPARQWSLPRALRGEVTVGLEAHMVRPDGTSYDILISAAPLRSSEGTIVGAVATFADITERKRAERALRESEAKFRSLYSAVGAGIVVHGPDGAIVDANDRAQEILGFPLDEIRGMTAMDSRWQVIHEDGTPFPGAEHPAMVALRTGQRVRDVAMGVMQPTGERRWLLVNAVPTVDPRTGAILGTVATFVDITERKEAEQFRDEYLSLISHDLRNPLATVMGMADWLRRVLEQKGLAREATGADSMLRSARRMSAMIQDLAESARLESGRLELRKEPTDVTQLVFDLAGRVGTMEDRARIQVEVPEWVPLVLADPTYLERAIVNLVTNALKYSPPENPVTVRVERTDGEARVAVIDRGTGIAAEEIPNLFQRFYRAKAGKRAEGLGLGLYITRLIVEAHGGHVWVESEVGKGSTFYFTVPLA